MLAHRMVGYLTLSSPSDELADIRRALTQFSDKTVPDIIT